jgi:hypothetical protein
MHRASPNRPRCGDGVILPGFVRLQILFRIRDEFVTTVLAAEVVADVSVNMGPGIVWIDGHATNRISRSIHMRTARLTSVLGVTGVRVVIVHRLFQDFDMF